MEAIIQEIFRGADFTPNEVQQIRSKIGRVNLKRKEFLLRPGAKINDIYYIQEGCLRSYFVDDLGKEHTLQFAIKGWWISDYIALFGKGGNRSVSNIQCIKEACLIKISKKDFDDLCDEIPKISRFHIKNLESAFAAFQNRILENLTLSAKERYLKFINTYPDIEQSVKNYHIASFLGITTESLSRIRKEIANI